MNFNKIIYIMQLIKLWDIVKITKWKKVNFSDKWEKWYIDIWILRTNQIVQYTNDNWVECNENDILIAWDWSKSWTIWYWLNWIIWSTLAKLEITEKDIYTPYVWEFLKSKFDYLNTYTSWAAIPHIRKEVLVWIQIPLPPLETQKAIVAKLDQIFAELDQTKSEIQKNLDNTDELWKSALNQAFQGDCEMKTIEELTTSIEYWIWETWLDKWDLRYVRITDIDEDYLLKDYDKKYIMLNEKSKLSILNKWDVLIARTWATFWKCLYFNSDEKSAFAWYLIRPNFKSEINTKYFSLFTQSWLYWNQANKLVSWWWQPQFNANAIKKVELPVPPLSEQEKIVEHLDQVSKEVKALKSQYQSQLDNLEELKKSVLDKAFRWEIN